MGKRKSRRSQLVERTEAEMLGLPIPQPKLKYCSFIPDELPLLAKSTDAVAIRCLAVDLGLYKKPEVMNQLTHRQIATDCLARLKLVTLANLPGTTAGLVALGEQRLRFAVSLLVRAGYGPAHFLVGKGGSDLTFEELVPRILRGLKDHDRRENNDFRFRDAVPDQDLFAPPKEEPPPAVAPKTFRLFDRHRNYIDLWAPKISRNVSGVRRSASHHRRHRTRPHTLRDVLRCGCIVDRTHFNKRGWFTVWTVVTRCAGHQKVTVRIRGRLVNHNPLVFETLHRRELQKKKKKRREERSVTTMGKPWTRRTR